MIKFENIKTSIYLLLPILFLWNCSTTNVEKINKGKHELSKQLLREVNLKVEKNISWINLMPGADEPKFNISGKIILQNGGNYNLKTTKLKFVKVYQNNKELYIVKPKVREEQKEESKTFLFSTIRGLSILKNLKKNMNVDFEYIFTDDGKEFRYQVKNVELQEVQ